MKTKKESGEGKKFILHSPVRRVAFILLFVGVAVASELLSVELRTDLEVIYYYLLASGE